MYKALVRSHLGYPDIIYHIPSGQAQLGCDPTERIQYKADLAVHVKVNVV